MKPFIRLRLIAASAPLALLSAGCQTPSAVYELAEKTSGNAAVFQSHLAEVATQSRALAQRRADHIVSMEAFNVRLDGTLKRELYMQQHSRKASDWGEIRDLMQQMTALRDDLVKIEQDARIAEIDRRKEILAKQADLNTYKAALRDVATALSALAKRESDAERAQFIGKFLREVRDDMNKSLESGDETSKNAKKLLDDLKSQIKNDEPADTAGGTK